MNYRLGLDIGIASVGFSVIETDDNGEPKRIETLGSRIFEKAEISDPRQNASLSAERRIARGIRRILRRRAHRRDRVKQMLIDLFGKDAVEKELTDKDLVKLRVKGLDEKLYPNELSAILLYFVKHRGYLSNRKSEEQEDDGGKLLKATGENSDYLKKSGYRTVGEMLYKDERYFSYQTGKDGKTVKVYTIRNKQNDYSNTFLRNDLKAELELILKKQASYGVVDQAFCDKYLIIFYNSRNYDEGPGEPSPYRGDYAIGKCGFEKDEYRAPKASATFEYAAALQKLNNLSVITEGTERKLTEEERAKVHDALINQKEITFEKVRKLLSIPAESHFNLLNYSAKKVKEDKDVITQTEKARFITLKNSYDIRKSLTDHRYAQNISFPDYDTEDGKKEISLLDEIAVILSTVKSDDKRLNKLNALSLTDAEKQNLLTLNFSGFGGTSIKFCRNILPFLRAGENYKQACESAGYDHTNPFGDRVRTKLLKSREIRESVETITSPVVKRAVSQAIKVINAVITAYGSPLAVNVELARDLSKSRDERLKEERNNKERAADNERCKKKLKEEHGIANPSNTDVIKYRLYEEQGGRCPYSDKPFDISCLFKHNYAQIDHVIPYSRSFDDSLNNKVLVFTEENQNKQNKTPFEYFGNDEKRWEKYRTFVLSRYSHNKRKADILLKKKWSEENEREFINRNLNDSRYIMKFIYNLISDNLEFAPCNSLKKKVRAVNGKITAYMRRSLGLVKDRAEGDKHHALDAAVIACVNDSQIQKITQYNKGKELRRFNKAFVNEDGEMISEGEFDKKYGLHLRPPYPCFTEELIARLSDNPADCKDVYLAAGYTEDQIKKIKPIFVSRAEQGKMTGAIHKSTIFSAKKYSEDGILIKKTPLKDLKLKDGRPANFPAVEGYEEWYIPNYYNPQSDLLLYKKLVKLLAENNKEAEKAFAAPVYKPRSDGSDGALVRSVKTTQKSSSGVFLKKVNGFAANGEMLRVDIFIKNGKYYGVPVYTKDFYAKKLPDKAVVAGKPWITMDESFEFLFSLRKNDLVLVKHKSGFDMIKTNTEDKTKKITLKESLLYYRGFGIATGSASFITHDNSYEQKSLGIKTLDTLQKCRVDIFGNVSFVEKETRRGFNGK